MRFMHGGSSFVWPRSFLWLVLGLVFLYLALTPFFKIFPYNFDVGEDLLRLLIVVVGVLILIESFRRDKGFKRLIWIVLGLVIAIVGLYIFLLGLNVALPFVFVVNKIILQVILALYSIYLIVGAFQQTKVIEVIKN